MLGYCSHLELLTLESITTLSPRERGKSSHQYRAEKVAVWKRPPPTGAVASVEPCSQAQPTGKVRNTLNKYLESHSNYHLSSCSYLPLAKSAWKLNGKGVHW